MENDEKEKLYNELSDTIKVQIDKLANLDEFTYSHVHNVPQVAKRICEKLEFTQLATIFCIRCAYLHDIGKIFIPPEILQKPEKLTEDEFEVIKTHTTKGYDFCKATEHLAPYAKGVRYHHENEDGTGYPDRLTNKEIPTEAEIIKVADIYDALTSKRQYRIVAYNRRTVIQILKEEMLKKHINKKVFKALLKVMLDDIQEDKKEEDRDLRTLLVQEHYINNLLEIY